MANLTLAGTLYSATGIEQKTESFRVRKFILEVNSSAGGTEYKNYIGFQLVNNNVALLDAFQPGQPVTVHFDVRGSLYKDTCITNLNAWKIEPAAAAQPAPQQAWGPQQQATPQQPAPVQQQWGPQQAQPAAPVQQPTTQPAQPAPAQWGAQPTAPTTPSGNLPF